MIQHRPLRSASLALVVVATLAAGCAKKEAVEISLSDPCQVRNDGSVCVTPTEDQQALCGTAFCTQVGTWAELAVFDGQCPTDADLQVGATNGASFRAVVSSEQGLPAPGDLSKSAYGFAVLLRDDLCNVVAYGCTNANLDKVRSISIEVDPTQPAGACVAPSTCAGGSCSGAGGGIHNDGGATGSCSLALVKSGALPAPLEPGANESGPAVAATATGFVIAYHEQKADTTAARVTTVTLTDDGQLGAPSYTTVGSCAGVASDDGLGLVTRGTAGLMAAVQPNCGAAGGGATFVTLDASGLPSAWSLVADPSLSISLAQAHALALAPSSVPGASSGDAGAGAAVYRFAYVAQGAANYFDIDEARAPLPAGFFPIAPGVTSSWAQVASDRGVIATLIDAPVDGGIGAQLSVGPASAEAGAPKISTLAGGSFGAVTAWPTRAIAVVAGAGGTLAWSAQSADGFSVGSGSLTGGPFTGADVAVLGTHVVVAGARPHGMTLFRIDGANSAKLATAAVSVPVDLPAGSVSLGSYEGKKIAVAASRQRVAVTWVTRHVLGSTDPVGGYAIFQCAQ